MIKAETILVLEDDARVLALERRALERAGYRVLAFSSAGEAEAELAGPEGAEINLIVLDYQLSNGQTGLEFFRKLSERMTVPPSILATGFSDEGRVLEALRSGVRDVIRKSHDFLDLLPRAVERVLREVNAERRAAEAEAARRAAEATSRTKDHFLAVLSHELRTPLTPVLAVVREMERNESLSPEVRDAFLMIGRNIELEARLIDDLLDLTKVSHGKITLEPRVLNLHEKVRHIVRMCEFEALGKEVRLTTELLAGRHFISGDSARIQQVLWNLVRNAIKFTPARGLVTVRSADLPDERIRLDIIDTGVGIRPESLPKVFDAFEQGDWQANRQFGGMGLGLAIAKALVTLHGGTIAAHSAGPDKGATFSVELNTVASPDSNAGSGATGAARSQAVDPASRPLSILLVEDHEDTAKALARLLRHSGHDVRTANSVSSAMRTVDAHAFDLLISDIGLPDGSGLDLMRQVRARAKIRGIVISGFGMESDIGRSREAGFLEHLTKPVNLGELEAAIRRVTAIPQPDPAGV